MQVITTLSNEQVKFFKECGTIIRSENGDTYFHLPFYFKDLGYNEFEMITEEDLPEDVQALAESEEVTQLKKELLLTEQLWEDTTKVLEAVPECPLHGNHCIPHAIDWIIENRKEIANKDNGLMPEIRKH